MPNHPNRAKTNRAAAANPTAAEVKRAREDANLTLEGAAEFVHATWHTWWKWEQPPGDANHRRMHPSTWELFNLKLRVRQMIEKGELTPAAARRMGIHLPAER